MFDKVIYYTVWTVALVTLCMFAAANIAFMTALIKLYFGRG